MSTPSVRFRPADPSKRYAFCRCGDGLACQRRAISHKDLHPGRRMTQRSERVGCVTQGMFGWTMHRLAFVGSRFQTAVCNAARLKPGRYMSRSSWVKEITDAHRATSRFAELLPVST